MKRDRCITAVTYTAGNLKGHLYVYTHICIAYNTCATYRSMLSHSISLSRLPIHGAKKSVANPGEQ